MPNTNIPVSELDFFKIKESLKSFMKGQNQFQDYDFEGSSMNIHMDLLAFATHYMGFYGHMLHNESHINSAVLKSSLVGKAKLMNYVPGSVKSAQATVTLTADVDVSNEPIDRKIVVNRGETLQSVNNASDNRSFVIVDDVYIYNQAQTIGQYDYTSDEILVHEGTFEREEFVVDASLLNQTFVIRDPKVDISTLRVRVYASPGDEDYQTFTRAKDFMTITDTSQVFFLTVNKDDQYEIQFGNDVYGQKLQNGNLVECSYVSTTGVSGNNAKLFELGAVTYDVEDYNMTVTTVDRSEGGMGAETLDDLRYNIPYHFRRQNRAVVVDDYKELILSEYRNVNSVNVWGGEDNIPKQYGKIFICIKPKFGNILSSKAKDNLISNIIKSRNVSVIEVEIVDPSFLYVNMDVFVQYNPIKTEKTGGEIITSATSAITSYNTDVLNRFDGFYSDLELNSRVRDSNEAILSSYTKLTLEKRLVPTLGTEQMYQIDFANVIDPGSIVSSDFKFRQFRCTFNDDGKGNIYIWYTDTNTGKTIKFDEVYGVADYENGTIQLSPFEITSLYSGYDYLEVFAKPSNPDFYTTRNNIIAIDDVKVNISENFETETS